MGIVLVLIGIQIAMFAFSLWWLHREDAGDDPGGGGGGGSERRPADGPLPGDQPVWWPEFESDFAAHVAGHRRHDRVGS